MHLNVFDSFERFLKSIFKSKKSYQIATIIDKLI